MPCASNAPDWQSDLLISPRSEANYKVSLKIRADSTPRSEQVNAEVQP